MPLRLDIDDLCLGDGEDSQGFYLYLLDNSDHSDYRFRGGVRYLRHAKLLECKNMVSDGYGPAMLILLAQVARRLRLDGVSPDSNKNSAEAMSLIEKMVNTPPRGVSVRPTRDLAHADAELNVVFSVSDDVVSEVVARRRFDTHIGKGWRGRLQRAMHPVEGVATIWHRPGDITRIMKADYLGRSDEVFRM